MSVHLAEAIRRRRNLQRRVYATFITVWVFALGFSFFAAQVPQ
jgi:hypothetical protein